MLYRKSKSKVHPTTGHKGREGEERSVLDGGVWSTPRPGRFTPGEANRSFVEEVAWAPGSVWTGAENLAPNRNSNPEPSSP